MAFRTLLIQRKVLPVSELGKISAEESAVLKPVYLGDGAATRWQVASSAGRWPRLLHSAAEHIRLLRPHQWIKNSFVLIPAFFGGKLADLFVSSRPALAFLAFCAAASGVYVLNDIFDAEKDRIHERKRLRPLASGTVSIKAAVTMLLLLVAAAAAMAFAVGRSFFYVVAGYVVLNLLYTLYFKRISLVDISFIAAGFILRVIGGGIATDLVISKWLILMTFLLACCLAVGKRRDDLLLDVDKVSVRPANGGYTLRFIDTCLVILGAVTIVCYIMYTVSDEVVRRLHTDNVYLTSVFVIIGMLRFLQIAIVEQKSGAPTMILLKDTLIRAMIGLWLLAFLLILYAR
jgi:4-hydroxybenzoate polyprenyltransferase